MAAKRREVSLFNEDDKLVLERKGHRKVPKEYFTSGSGSRTLTTDKNCLNPPSWLNGASGSLFNQGGVLVGISSDITILDSELKETQDLLAQIAQPESTLSAMADGIAERLIKRYSSQGFESVYVIQHQKESKEFEIIAVAPSRFRDHRSFRFPDEQGVAGWVFSNKGSYFSEDVGRSEIQPLKNWRAVVASPIIEDDGTLWGVLSVNGNSVSSEYAAWRVKEDVERYAQEIACICRISELVENRGVNSQVASELLSLYVEAHDLRKLLQGARLAAGDLINRKIDELICQIGSKSEEFQLLDGLQWLNGTNRQLELRLARASKWADTCATVGKFLQTVNDSSEWPVKVFLQKNRSLIGEFDLVEACKSAMEALDADLERNTGAKIDSFEAPSRLVVEGYRTLFEHGFLNAVQNAIEHGTRREDERKSCRIQIVVEETSEGYAKLTVRNTGFKMPRNAVENLNQFYHAIGVTPTEPIGYGTLVMGIAARIHGGNVRVDTQPGWTNSVFTLSRRVEL